METPIFTKIQKFFTKSKIFAGFLISFCVGVLLADLVKFDETTYLILAAMILMLILVFLLWHRFPLFKIFSGFAIFLILGLSYCGWFNQKHTPQNIPYGKSINFTGVIVEEPDIRENKIQLTLKIEEVEKNNQMQNLLGQKILVSVGRYPEYKYGDKLKIFGPLEKIENFGDFDYQKYLERYLIYVQIIHPTNVEYINGNNASNLKFELLKIKNNFQTAIEKSLPEPLSSLAGGLVVGAKSGFSPALKDEMVKTGTTHIVVISGQNMEIVTKVFVEITKYWPISISFAVGVLGLMLYTILTGASASVVRAAILASLFIFARVVGRKKNVFNLLIFTGFVMVIINPLILKFDLGFQLSFMAMLGLIFITPVFQAWFGKWPKIIQETLSATLGAQLATLPIILFNFGRLSTLAPVINALIVPAVPYVMAAAFLVGLSGMFWLPLGQFFGIIFWPFLKYIIYIIQSFAKIPWVSVNVNFHNWRWLFLYYLIIVYLLVIWNRKYGKTKK